MTRRDNVWRVEKLSKDNGNNLDKVTAPKIQNSIRKGNLTCQSCGNWEELPFISYSTVVLYCICTIMTPNYGKPSA